jgi:hypothetical protein
MMFWIPPWDYIFYIYSITTTFAKIYVIFRIFSCSFFFLDASFAVRIFSILVKIDNIQKSSNLKYCKIFYFYTKTSKHKKLWSVNHTTKVNLYRIILNASWLVFEQKIFTSVGAFKPLCKYNQQIKENNLRWPKILLPFKLFDFKTSLYDLIVKLDNDSLRCVINKRRVLIFIFMHTKWKYTNDHQWIVNLLFKK